LQVTLEYLQFVSDDCRVAKLISSNSEIFAFENDLLVYNLDLWGCRNRNVNRFGLIHASVTDLTSADAARLIDNYIAAATLVLELNAREATQVRQDLAQQSATAITRSGDDYALSTCTAEAGVESDGSLGDASPADCDAPGAEHSGDEGE
jgi:hypothetical protein